MPPGNFKELVDIFIDLTLKVLPVITGLALLAFIWGLVKFIFRLGGSEEAVKEGKQLMVWGLIALFILVSFWAILAFAHRDVGFSGPFGPPLLPEAPSN